MLEVRYKKDTGEITALAGSPRFTGGHLESKDGEEIVVLDCLNPVHPPGNYLVIDGQLKLVKEPEPVVSLKELDKRMKRLEGGT